MRFGPVPVREAEGAIAAHSLKFDGGVVKKGAVITPETREALEAAGILEIIAARLDPDDVHEDEAAARLAAAWAGPNVRVDPAFTGRANLFAERAGVLRVDGGAIDRFNAIDEAVTVATLDHLKGVVAGEMVATVKIIPFAAPGAAVEGGERTAGDAVIAIVPFGSLKIGVVATTLPVLKPSVMDKTRRILESRLEPAGARIIAEKRVPHDASDVAAALANPALADADLLLVYGASAIVDRRDVVPEGIERAGGTVRHFGMPVDPGNLMLLADLDGRPVIGAPGCARSPKENGFDWVLQRVLAGIDVTPDDVKGMGVGGLLMEIVSRPQPRAEQPAERESRPKVSAIVLAAGQSQRMGARNKLLEQVGGKAMVRIATEAALGSCADEVIVVTGHEAERVAGELDDLSVRIVDNPDFAEGLSTSLRAGLSAVSPDSDAAIIALADMPRVTSSVLDHLIDVFSETPATQIVVPTFEGKRGNPVLWGRRFFADLMTVEGDVGGRALIGAHADLVSEIDVGADVELDVDTPEALARVRDETT